MDYDVAVCESAVATLNEMEITAEWGGQRTQGHRTGTIDVGHRNYYDMILIDRKMPDIDGLALSSIISSYSLLSAIAYMRILYCVYR